MLTKREIKKLTQIGRSHLSALEWSETHNSKERHLKRIKQIKETTKKESSICSICGRLGAYHNFQWMPWSSDNGSQEMMHFCERNIHDRRFNRVLTPDYKKTEYAQALMILKTGINIGD